MLKILFLFTLVILVSCQTENPIDDKNNVENGPQTLNSNETEVGTSPSDNGTSTNRDNVADSKKISTSNYSYKVIYEEQTGWGYQIFDGSKMVINQMHIPAVQGIQGFSSQKKAEKTAQYVVEQIEKGNFPPTLSEEILDSLNVL